jgi:hypothetical protein
MRFLFTQAIFALLLVLAGHPPDSVAAQDAAPSPWTRAAPAPVPYSSGERMNYQVRLGRFNVGEGHLAVLGIDTVRGHPTYHVQMRLRGGIPLARVNDRFESWIDTHTLASRRYLQDIHEVNYKRFRHYEFYPEEMRYVRMDVDDRGELPTHLPLDDISFVYFVRTLPLVVGETYTYNRYFNEDGNPVVLQVVRRDRVTVPAGTFNTIVIRPIIQTRGLFGEGGEAEIHFSDDSRRLMVMMTSRVPVVGSLSLHLTDVVEGHEQRSAGEPRPRVPAADETDGDP